MRITLHVYRTHDHDLMALHQAGVLSVGQAAKQAVIAYYKGDPLCISTKTNAKPDISLMPLSVTFGFVISESDAKGITAWIKSIRAGYRNCFFKNVLRHYLDDPATYLFRDDEWQATMPEEIQRSNPIAIPAAPKHVNNGLMGSQWVEAVAKAEKKKYTNKKISDLDDLLKQPDPPQGQDSFTDPPPGGQSSSTNLPHRDEDKDNDDFDVYAEFLKMRNGE